MSTLAHKLVMAMTGLFLCSFLVVHLAGNLQLLLPEVEARRAFNAYSELLSGNPLITVISFGLYGAILLHAVLAGFMACRDRRAGGRYLQDRRSEVSPWYSRNMGLLGTVVLVFLVVHFRDFWYPFRFGAVARDGWGNRDLYSVVQASFAQGWYVLAYVLSMLALGYHLLHGVESATRSLGLHHARFRRWLRRFGRAFSVLVTLGFVVIPVFMHFARAPQ